VQSIYILHGYDTVELVGIRRQALLPRAGADFDIVLFLGLRSAGSGSAAASRKRDLPYVLEPIGMFVPIVRNLWLKRMYHALWGRQLLEGASAVIATFRAGSRGNWVAVSFRARGGVAAERRGVLNRGPHEHVPKGARYFRRCEIVLFLGRLSVKKSPELLLQAFGELLNARRDPLLLVFAGQTRGEYRPTGSNGITTGRSVKGSIRRTSFWRGAKWRGLRDGMFFAYFPSQNENFGNTAAEAVAAGTPVIVTEQCGLRHVLWMRLAWWCATSRAALIKSA